MANFSRPRYGATVITRDYQITGQIEPIGPWLDFLNAKGNGAPGFPLCRNQAPLEPGGTQERKHAGMTAQQRLSRCA